MPELKSLQELINQKAEYRLNVEIGKISALIKENRLLCVTDNPGLPDIYLKKEDGTYYDGRKPYWFFDVRGELLEEVKKYWLPIFVSEEAESFLKRVEELDSQIQDLKSVEYTGDY